MGSLKPGATYIYERADGVTYAREFGSSNRTPVGWDYDTQMELEKRKEDLLWSDIRLSAESNEELQIALERVKIIYYLSIKDGQE